jgi:hypothetical protein
MPKPKSQSVQQPKPKEKAKGEAKQKKPAPQEPAEDDQALAAVMKALEPILVLLATPRGGGLRAKVLQKLGIGGKPDATVAASSPSALAENLSWADQLEEEESSEEESDGNEEDAPAKPATWAKLLQKPSGTVKPVAVVLPRRRSTAKLWPGAWPTDAKVVAAPNVAGWIAVAQEGTPLIILARSQDDWGEAELRRQRRWRSAQQPLSTTRRLSVKLTWPRSGSRS